MKAGHHDLADTRVDAPGASVDGCEGRPDPIALGTRLDGGVELVRTIGHGSMGVVYEGRDRSLGRRVAVKVLDPRRVAASGLREQFHIEARAMARVRHRNVLEIHALGHHADLPYYVMEFVDGEDLSTWLDGHGRQELAVDTVLSIIEPLSRGIEALHEAGVVHRDLKPSNVLVGELGRVVVADFGLARPLNDVFLDERRAVAGTPAYLAPELICGDDVPATLAPRVDVYALAVLAFELLTGEQPIAGRAVLDVLQAQVYDAPLRPSELRPTLGTAVDDVFAEALHKDPARRTASPGDSCSASARH